MNFEIFVVIIVVLFILLLTKKAREQVLRPAQDKIVGICSSALDQTVRKSANKEKIGALLGERGELSNADIREALGISDRSVIRYMDELEREGRVEQVGNTGRGVIYRLK